MMMKIKLIKSIKKFHVIIFYDVNRFKDNLVFQFLPKMSFYAII